MVPTLAQGNYEENPYKSWGNTLGEVNTFELEPTMFSFSPFS